MYKNLNERNIPLILLNARITKKTFKRWIKIKSFAKLIFNKISIAYPQNLETKNFLKKLNTKNIKYIGNLKFAENDDENLLKINQNLKKQLNKKKLWVASSTHHNEETFCVLAHLELKKRIKNLITIIIPRHVHRAKTIIKEIEKKKIESSFTQLKTK